MVRKRRTPPDEIERMEERMDTYYRGKIVNEQDFNFYYSDLTNLDADDLTSQQQKFRKDTWLVYAGNHSLEIMRKDVPELKKEVKRGVSLDKRRKLKVVSAPSELPKIRGLTMKQIKAVAKERKKREKERKSAAAKAAKIVKAAKVSRHKKRFTRVGYVKSRLVYVYPVKFTLRGKQITRYKDKRGLFVSLKRKRA